MITSIISNFFLLWMFVSVVEIAFINSTGKKTNNYNIFVLSNNIKSMIAREGEEQFYTDIITDDSCVNGEIQALHCKDKINL